MRLLAPALFAVVVCTAPVARATVVMDLTGPELAAVSDAIVHARVLSVKAEATPDARVMTTAELEVIEGLKGVGAGARVRVVYPGGVAKGLGMLVSGQLALEENSECVLYLSRNDASSFIPAAMTLGYFAIKKRDYDGVRIARRTTNGITLVRRVRVAGQVQTVVAEPRDVRAPLTTVLSDIRQDLTAAKVLKREAILGDAR